MIRQIVCKMKKVIIFCGIILLSGLLNISKAQDQAKAVLDEVSTTLTSYETLQADFSFTLSNVEADIEDTFEGKLVLQGKKYRLSMMGILIMCDGEKLWNYVEEMNEVSILDADDSEFFNPTQIFNLYKKDYDLETLNQQGSEYQIKLTPQVDDQDFSHIILSVDKAKKRILGASYFGTDGNTYKIKISNTLTNVQVDDRFFMFDPKKYPGVDIFDMR